MIRPAVRAVGEPTSVPTAICCGTVVPADAQLGVVRFALTAPPGGGGPALWGKPVPPPQPAHPMALTHPTAPHRGRAPERSTVTDGRSISTTCDLEDCYRSFGPRVRAYLRRYVPAGDLEDVLQVVFCEVWQSRARYDPQRSLEGWILAIARKRAIDHLRKRRHHLVPLGLVSEPAGDDGRDWTDRLGWAQQMAAHLAALPAVQREVLVMAYYGGSTQTEIAAELNISVNTVKTRTRRGLQRLAESLTDTRPPALDARSHPAAVRGTVRARQPGTATHPASGARAEARITTMATPAAGTAEASYAGT